MTPASLSWRDGEEDVKLVNMKNNRNNQFLITLLAVAHNMILVLIVAQSEVTTAVMLHYCSTAVL